MKITIDIPDEIAQNSTLSQADWLREVAGSFAVPKATRCSAKN